MENSWMTSIEIDACKRSGAGGGLLLEDAMRRLLF